MTTMPNIERIVHPDEQYDQGKIHTVLEHGEPTKRIDCRITGTVQKTSGANNDAAVYSDHLQRLIAQELRADSLSLMESEISLRELYDFHRLCSSEIAPRSEVDVATINAGNPVDFEIAWSVWGFRPYLVNPSDTFFPAFDGRRGPSLNQGFRLFHNWDSSQVNASSDPGTGAIFSAGSDTYEFTSGPTLETSQVIMPGLNKKPWVIPVLETFDSEPIQQAVSDFVMRFQNEFTFDMLVAKYIAESDEVLQAAGSVNNLGLISSSTDIIDDDTRAWEIEQQAINRFIGYHGESGTPGGGHEATPSTFPLDVTGGRLSQRVNPRTYTDLRLIADLDAPSSAPGRLRLLQAVDRTIEGVTRRKNA